MAAFDGILSALRRRGQRLTGDNIDLQRRPVWQNAEQDRPIKERCGRPARPFRRAAGSGKSRVRGQNFQTITVQITRRGSVGERDEVRPARSVVHITQC